MRERAARALREVLPRGARLNRILAAGPRIEPGRTRVIIAVPAKDEAGRIEACLEALATSAGRTPDPTQLLILVNDTVDATVDRALAAAGAGSLATLVACVTLPPREAHAGTARGVAMDAACRLGAPEAVVMTTDADSRADQDWIGANLAEIGRGAALVGGRIEWNHADAVPLPPAVQRASAAECRYLDLMRRLEWLLDPDPWNPWPHHGTMSGASMAATCASYRDVGGLPRVPVSEDRAMLARYRARDLPVVFSDAARVVTSGRADGRAPGGMADTVAERLRDADAPIDAFAEPARDWLARLRWRAQARVSWRVGADLGPLCRNLGLGSRTIEAARAATAFGAAWRTIEAASRFRGRSRLRPSQLPLETARLVAIVAAAEARLRLPVKDAPPADLAAVQSP